MLVNTGDYLNKDEQRKLREFWHERGLFRFHSMNAATSQNMHSDKQGFKYRDVLHCELWSYETLVAIAQLDTEHDNTTRSHYRFYLAHGWNLYGPTTTRHVTRFVNEFANVRGYVDVADLHELCDTGCSMVFPALYNHNNPHDQKLNVEIRASDNNNGCEPIAHMLYESERERSRFATSGVR